MAKTSSEQTGKNGDPEQFDLVILGSGAGGKLAAWTYGRQGKRVAVIERKYIGGACPNIACLPYTALSDAIIAHPTLAEGIGPLFGSAPSVKP